MHIGIAVLLGLPIFSAAMIVADAAFLPDRFYRAAARAGRRVLRRLRPAVSAPSGRTPLVPPRPRDPGPIPASDAPVPSAITAATRSRD